MTAGPTDGDDGVRRSAWRWVRLAALLACVWLGYQLLAIGRGWALAILSVILDIAFGGIIALLALPLVNWLDRRWLPRAAAAIGVVLVALLAVGGLGFWLGLSLVSELQNLVAHIPAYLAEAQHAYHHTIEGRLAAAGINIDLTRLVTSETQVANIAGRLPDFLVGAVTASVQLVANILIALVVGVWLLTSGPALRDSIAGWLPVRERAVLAFALEAIIDVGGSYVRAQLLLALVIGLLAGTGSALLGVPFPIVIGAVAAVFELVPIIGPFVAGAVALLLAVTVSWGLVLWTLLLFLGIHALEGYILAPRLQARFVRIPPLAALLAVLAGAEAGGFIGALFAVPVASLLFVFGRAILTVHRERHPERWQADDLATLVDRERARLRERSAVDPGRRVSRLVRSLRRRAGERREVT